MTSDDDADHADHADRTMQRLELVQAFDEWFPQWRTMVGESRREGSPIGWLDPSTSVAGALLEDYSEVETSIEATALPWREQRRSYYLLRPPENRSVWVRALPAYPATYVVEALVLTAVAEPDNQVRRWQALTADERPVMLTDADATNRRPWLLRENCLYDISHDIEGGWQVWAREDTIQPA